MHDLMDEVYFTIPYDDDYIMRLNAYYSEGNSIRIRLYEVDSERLFNELTKNYTINADNQNVLEEIRKYFKDKVFNTIIPRLVRLVEAPSHGKPINEYDPLSRATEAYANLAKEVVSRDGN